MFACSCGVNLVPGPNMFGVICPECGCYWTNSFHERFWRNWGPL